jgi:hypothetical protein
MNAAPARRHASQGYERRLRVVPPPGLRAPRAPFVVVVVAILAAGLVGLLLLNTALAQGSFRVHDLQRQTAAMQDREQQLQIAVDAADNPARLAAAAHGLGLVAAQDPGFLRLSDGRVLGAPQAATAAPKKKPATPTPQSSITPSGQPSPQTATKPTARTTTKPAAKPTTRATPGPAPTPGHGAHR